MSAVSSPQKLATFFAHHCHFHSGVAHFSGLHKIAAPFVGPLYVGALARPNMLNMSKSAAGLDKLLLLRYYCTFLRINLHGIDELLERLGNLRLKCTNWT